MIEAPNPGGPGSDEPRLDLGGLRRSYDEGLSGATGTRAAGLSEDQLDPDPLVQFTRWLGDAVVAGQVVEPNAMVLATATPEAVPSARLVLLKSVDAAGFVFYTNHTSRKAHELDANPRVALTFPWHAIARQVRVEGVASRVSAAESASYFRSRPHDSQVGTWASHQSAPLGTRTDLDERFARLGARWPEGTPVPVPDFWGGYRVVPSVMEFWAGRPSRLHDRFVYRRAGPAEPWSVVRLAP